MSIRHISKIRDLSGCFVRPPKQKKKKSLTIVCKDCGLTFTSKINPKSRKPYIRCYDCFRKDVDRRGNQVPSRTDTAGSKGQPHPLTYHTLPNSPSEDNSIVESNNPGSVPLPLPGQVSPIQGTSPTMNDKASLSIEDILINL